MYNCLKRRTLLFKRCFSATDNKECAILKQNGANYVHKKKKRTFSSYFNYAQSWRHTCQKKAHNRIEHEYMPRVIQDLKGDKYSLIQLILEIGETLLVSYCACCNNSIWQWCIIRNLGDSYVEICFIKKIYEI